MDDSQKLIVKFALNDASSGEGVSVSQAFVRLTNQVGPRRVSVCLSICVYVCVCVFLTVSQAFIRLTTPIRHLFDLGV